MYLTKWKHQVFGETIGDTYLTLEILYKDKVFQKFRFDVQFHTIILFLQGV